MTHSYPSALWQAPATPFPSAGRGAYIRLDNSEQARATTYCRDSSMISAHRRGARDMQLRAYTQQTTAEIGNYPERVCANDFSGRTLILVAL
jgi:hypothetical protein